MADDIAGQLLGLAERASWCGDTDPTGRYVCQRIRNHALDWHECLNDKGGRHMWKVAVDPADLPFGALLRDPKSGRWAVRFQVDDTTGKGMHAWLVPPTIDHPEVRVLHHVEVRGWQPFEIIIDQVNRLEGERDGILTQLVRLAKEFERVRASREAWAIEADWLDAELKKRPTAWAYEQADRALEKRRVALVEALGARPGAGFYDSVDDVAELLRDQAALSGMLRGMARRASAMRRALRARPAIPADRSPVVCLCGSMRFEDEIREAAREESIAGHIVVLPLCNMKQPHPLWNDDTDVERIKVDLDGLHKAKIDLADEIVVVSDASGYIGDSTRSEIAYAEAHGKPVRYWSAPVSGSDTTADEAAEVPGE